MITTEAWTLKVGRPDDLSKGMVQKDFSFDDLHPDEVLLEPLVGCWEANMTHAIIRDPVDIVHQRHEEEIVLGNSGVCRVADVGSDVHTHKAGELVFYGCAGKVDAFSYVELVSGYDAPGTVGTLAKKTKLKAEFAFKLPTDSSYTLEQWASYPRYWTAWDNQHVAMACLRSQLSEEDLPRPHVWSWGGGVGIAQLSLANRMGCQTAMMASTDARLEEIEAAGIRAIDRREFEGLRYDPSIEDDRKEKRRYFATLRKFMSIVKSVTNGEGVHIFIDNIGTPVYPATLRALARQGVISTCGWKEGMQVTNMRALECITRHIHVHTHAIRAQNCDEVIAYQEKMGWIAPEPDRVWDWDNIQMLSDEYELGRIDSYFPIFRVQS